MVQPMQTTKLSNSLYLTFRLADEVFGLEILSVKEILEYRELTAIPTSPEYIRGVINLRGQAIPVIDLTVKFGGNHKDITSRSCIVIIETLNQSNRRDIGFLVDAVDEVVEIPTENIEPAPSFGTNIRLDYISGMGNVNDSFIIILNPHQIVSDFKVEYDREHGMKIKTAA